MGEIHPLWSISTSITLQVADYMLKRCEVWMGAHLWSESRVVVIENMYYHNFIIFNVVASGVQGRSGRASSTMFQVVALATTLIGFFVSFIHYRICDVCLVHGCVMLDCCGFVIELARQSLRMRGLFDPSKGQSWPHHHRKLYLARCLGQYLDHPWLQLGHRWQHLQSLGAWCTRVCSVLLWNIDMVWSRAICGSQVNKGGGGDQLSKPTTHAFY